MSFIIKWVPPLLINEKIERVLNEEDHNSKETSLRLSREFNR